MWVLIALGVSDVHVIHTEKFATLTACIAQVDSFKRDLAKQYPTLKWRDISCYPVQGASGTF